MTAINETKLPGVGIRHDFLTKAGERVGVILHHTGQRDLLIYDHQDPDYCQAAIRLNEDDSHSLADLLGASQIKDDMETLKQSLVGGLTIDWIRLNDDSYGAGKSIGEMHVRAATGVFIVAVMHKGQVTPSPGADYELQSGDTMMIIGTPQDVKAAEALLLGT